MLIKPSPSFACGRGSVHRKVSLCLFQRPSLSLVSCLPLPWLDFLSGLSGKGKRSRRLPNADLGAIGRGILECSNLAMLSTYTRPRLCNAFLTKKTSPDRDDIQIYCVCPPHPASRTGNLKPLLPAASRSLALSPCFLSAGSIAAAESGCVRARGRDASKNSRRSSAALSLSCSPATCGGFCFASPRPP